MASDKDRTKGRGAAGENTRGKAGEEAGGAAIVEGVIERITFRNEETGYTVARLTADAAGGHRGVGLVTVIGTFASLTPGERLRLVGRWTTHPQYGPQFTVTNSTSQAPATLTGIEKYLGSGLVKGIGPATAKKIVSRFGLDTLSVIEDHPERLAEVPGIGVKKAASIQQALAEQAYVRDVMIFLEGHGVSPAYASRIYRRYREEAIAKVQQNPYALADEVHGIGFKTADRIARGLGVSEDDPRRVTAALKYLLSQKADDGHVYTPREVLFAEAKELVATDDARLSSSLSELLQAKQVYVEPLSKSRVEAAGGEDGDDGPLLGQTAAVYLAPFYHAERGVTTQLVRLARRKVQQVLLADAGEPAGGGAGGGLAAGGLVSGGPTLAPEQVEAVKLALVSGIAVITGGPGTGKTTTLKAIVEAASAAGLRVVLAAPTGRAAKRMSEATGSPARTLHRLLEFGYQEGGAWAFGRHAKKPVDAELVIVDESSMVDLLLFYHLLLALGPDARLVLVGDADQLPSVGAGNVLKDVLAAGVIPSVRLTTIFRQAGESMIVVNAHRINRGEFPQLNRSGKDFWLMEAESPREAAELIASLVSRRLPRHLRVDPVDDIQVLSPMRRGGVGVDQLNVLLQETLLPKSAKSGGTLTFGGVSFHRGDKVMQIRNNYQKSVFNGDIGRIVAIDLEEQELRVQFPTGEGDRVVTYDRDELDELVLAYAVTVHKSQGSEYPVVVLALSTSHYPMLQRNLLYTAVTRARRFVVIVGAKKAVAMAVRNSKTEERYTLLADRLKKEFSQHEANK